MTNSILSVYETFRTSMLNGSEDWKALLADDAQLHGPLASVEGKDAFIAVNEPFFASIQRSELRELVIDGRRVLTRIETTIMTPAGEDLTLRVAEWYTIKDGKIQSLEVYFDTVKMRAALGMPG